MTILRTGLVRRRVTRCRWVLKHYLAATEISLVVLLANVILLWSSSSAFAIPSNMGLPANVAVPAWAVGQDIHFFAGRSPVLTGGLGEPVTSELGRRCEEAYCPEPPLLYHVGKGVQHAPSVHVIFWGKNWEKAPGTELRTQLLKMYESISGSAWQGILTQYFDSTGRVSSTITFSSYIDTGVTAPSSVNDRALREEVANGIKTKGWAREFSSQFVVIPAPGATYTAFAKFTANTTKGSATLTSVSSFTNVVVGEHIAGPGIPGVAEVTSINTILKTATLSKEATVTATGVALETEGFDHGFCGYHGVDGSGSSYTFVAYPGEEPFKKGCIEFDPKENADHVTSMIASHEYAESATDPQVEPEFSKNAEWYTSNGYEIGDICASGDSELSNGSWVQGLWDDHQSECSLSDKEPPHVYAVTEPATGIKAYEAKLNGIVNPESSETAYHFEYGPTTSYGTRAPVPDANVGAGASNQSVTQSITGLEAEKAYHFRLVATNSTGTTYGEDHAFTTTRWSIQTTPHPAKSEASKLSGVSCTSSVACTAVGFNDEGGDKSLAERWNGTEWSIQSVVQPSAEFSELKDVSCTSSAACTAVGSEGYPRVPLAESWNGTEWSLQTTPSPKAEYSELTSVSCTSSTACTAVGIYGYPLTMFTERWNGTEWSIQAIGNPSGAKQTRLYDVSCVSSEACTAVGAYESSAGFYGGLAERWNGAEWSQQEIPSPTGAILSELAGVSCESTTECIAVGGYESSSNVKLTLAERWNGTKWSIQTIPTPPAAKGSSVMLSVACSSAPACTAVGEYYLTASGTGQKSATLSEFWNGTEWNIQETPNPASGLNELKSVTCTPPEACIAVGSYQSHGPVTMLAERIAPPTATTEAATSVGVSGATVNGTVNPEGQETTYRFEYGETTSYGTRVPVPDSSAGSGASNVKVSKAITGLSSNTTYHFRLVATNGSGATYGADQRFTTTASKSYPLATTEPATNVIGTGARLNGTLNPEGLATTYHFEYGKTTSYGTSIPVPSANAGAGENSLEEARTVTGLELNTTYHFRIVATNSAGTTEGADKAFTTLVSPLWRVSSTPNPTGEKQSRLEGVSCASASACTAIGYYEGSSGATLALAEGWNGEEWKEQTVSTPTGATETELNGVSCTSLSVCTAVGAYLNSAGVWVPLAERWNGGAWAVQEPPSPAGAKASGLLGVSCASTSACTAVGAYIDSVGAYVTLAESWNGTAWSIKETPNPAGAKQGQLLGVSCASSNACTAVGEYENSAGTAWLAQAEIWNGETWSLQEPPSPTGATTTWPNGVSCTSASACTAIGYFIPSTGGSSTLAESWNGRVWTVQSTPNPTGAQNNELRGVSCTSSTVCTAVGFYDHGSPVEELTLAERWNGTEWSIQTTPNPTGAPYNRLLGVSCTSSTMCAGIGYYFKSKGEENMVTLAEIYG